MMPSESITTRFKNLMQETDKRNKPNCNSLFSQVETGKRLAHFRSSYRIALDLPILTPLHGLSRPTAAMGLGRIYKMAVLSTVEFARSRRFTAHWYSGVERIYIKRINPVNLHPLEMAHATAVTTQIAILILKN